MKSNKILKIFMHPHEFPCGEQSSCCGSIGQTQEEVQSLKSSIEKELGYAVEVLNVKNEDEMKNHPRIVQLLQSLGLTALPILTLEDEVVFMGNTAPKDALAAILEKQDEKEFGRDNQARGHENPEQAGGQESPGNVQACCPSASGGRDCCQSGSDDSGKTWKMVVFILILLAAGVVLARSFLKQPESSTDQPKSPFATIQPQVKSDTPSPVESVAKKQTLAESKGDLERPVVLKDTTKKDVSDKAASTLWGPDLDSLTSLNKVAADSDAVFILLAAEDQQSSQPMIKQIEAAAKKIRSNGSRIYAFRLKKNAPKYAQLAKQFSVPSVLAMVKGRGTSGVSGEITEAKLIQAFVTASRPGGGCCPGAKSCGPVRKEK